MSTIQSLGIGSGLKIDEIVTALVDAERVPSEVALDNREEIANAKISAYGEIQSRLSSFQSSLSALKLTSNFNQREATSSNTTAFTATASSLADAGSSYSVEIAQTAQAQSLATPAFTGIDDVIGTGTLTVKFGTTTIVDSPYSYGFVEDTSTTEQVLTIDSSNNTVSSLKDHINNNDYGFTASIINDGSGYRLVLTGESGADNSLQLTVSGDGDGNDTNQAGLSQLTMDGTQQYLTQNVEATDAALTINGIAITSETNTISNAVNGVTLELLSTTTSPASLTITAKTEEVKEQVTAMVEAYNELTSYTSELTAYNSTNGEGSLLLGDSTTRTLVSQLRATMFDRVTGVTGELQALSNIGIATSINDGTITFDEDVFDAAMTATPTAFQALFAASGTTTDADIQYISGTSFSKEGTYDIEIIQLATKASYVGTGALPDFGGGATLDIDADNEEFEISIDGVSSGTLTLTNATYSTGESLATEIQNTINDAAAFEGTGVSITVTYDSLTDDFTFESGSYGSGSSIVFQTVDTNTLAELGFTDTAGTQGLNVAGTIDGVAGSGSGQFLQSTSGDSTGLKIGVLGGIATSPGGEPRGTITFSRGIADQLDTLVDSFLDSSDGTLANRLEGLDTTINTISDEKDSLTYRMERLEARLLAQFNAIDIVVGQLNNLSSFLTSALAALPNSPKSES